MRIKVLDEYPYLYETHLHTNQGSACGSRTGAEMAEVCKKAGYSGMFVTDHNWGGNTCVNKELLWERWISLYAMGYYDAKKYGDSNDLDVFFGMESGFSGTEFLLLGLNPEDFLEIPALRSASIEEQYQLIHSKGGIVIQAHPYREEPYIPEVRVFPQYADGLECSNATHSSPRSVSHNNPSWDDLARKLALDKNKPMTAGSDLHGINVLGGGVAFKRRIRSASEFCKAIIDREDYILADGKYWRNKRGEIICEMEIR